MPAPPGPSAGDPRPHGLQRPLKEAGTELGRTFLLQQDARNHIGLIVELEREVFQKDEAIATFRASDSVQKDVASLVAELRQRDDDLDKLRMRAATEEVKLSRGSGGPFIDRLLFCLSGRAGHQSWGGGG